MKIVRITLWKVALTSHEVYFMASGKTCHTVDSIVLRLDTDEGVCGWGEVCPIPQYLAAYASGVAPAVEELAPALLGSDPIGPEAVMAALDARHQGHPYAKSAVDIALWDLTARTAGLPLYRLLGGRHAAALPLYHSITCIAPDEMAAIACDAQRRGISQFQVKLGADEDWQMDVERLVKVREAVGQGPLVYGDWNCGASQLDAMRIARAVARYDLMLEQPCATLESCATVKQVCSLPMKIDEGAYDIASLLHAHALGCLDAVALKLSKFGGLGATRRARDLCLHLGAKLCIEDTWGSDIVTATALHLGAATPQRALLNVCDLSGYVSPRLDPSGPVRDGGSIRPGETPGHGINPDPAVLGRPLLILD